MRSSVACLKISPSRRPCSPSPSNKASVLIALLPSISIASMAGRSFNEIINTSSSLSTVMSSKRPVLKSERTMSPETKESISSPIFTGSSLNTVPAETRCRPCNRISDSKKTSKFASVFVGNKNKVATRDRKTSFPLMIRPIKQSKFKYPSTLKRSTG